MRDVLGVEKEGNDKKFFEPVQVTRKDNEGQFSLRLIEVTSLEECESWDFGSTSRRGRWEELKDVCQLGQAYL